MTLLHISTYNVVNDLHNNRLTAKVKLTMVLGWFSKERPHEDVYFAAVERARDPWFYTHAGVPDEIAGRFELVALHVSLILVALERHNLESLGHDIVEVMYKDFDRSLREFGVGDLVVGKKVRGMAEAFWGRARSYKQAAELGEDDPWKEALQKNLFREQEGLPDQSLHNMIIYAKGISVKLQQLPKDLLMWDLSFLVIRVNFRKLCNLSRWEMGIAMNLNEPLIKPEDLKGETPFSLSIDQQICEQWCRDLNVLDLKNVALDVILTPVKMMMGLHLKGRLTAQVELECGITLEPFTFVVDEVLDAEFLPESLMPSLPEHDGDIILDQYKGDLPELLTEEGLDLLVFVHEILAVAIPAFPKKPQASFKAVISEEIDKKPSPFASLKEKLFPDD